MPPGYHGRYLLHTHGCTMVGIHLPTMPGTTPPWVYHLLFAYPVYRSSCPSSGPSAGERALGSKEGILLGRGLSPLLRS